MKFDLSKHQTESRAVSKGACPSCGSSDANVTYSDNHTYCFACETFVSGNNSAGVSSNSTVNNVDTSNWAFSSLTDRGIKEETAKFYGVKSEKVAGNIVRHRYPLMNQNGKEVAHKVRVVATKEFIQYGDAKQATQLFGQHLFQKGGLAVTITEGECDAMAAYEMTGSKYAVVSLKSSAGAKRQVQENYEWLNSFKKIVLCLDMDEKGEKAAREIASVFEPKKVRIMKMDRKDANEYLRENRFKDFVDHWHRADIYTPAGIINLADVGDALYDEGNQKTCLYPWKGLNEKLYGLRTGELVTLTAGTGTGKSSIMRELMYHILSNTEDSIGVLALEENIRQTCFHLMSVPANDRLYLREVRATYTKEQMQEFEKKTIGTRRFYAFDHFGSIANDEILDRVRYMIKALDCRWIFLDHLSILVSGEESGNERKDIDVLMTKLRSLVEETNCGLVLVSHLRRTTGDKGAEDGKEISLGHLRGSQAIAQLSDAVIALERNQQADDPTEANTTKVRVLKNRYAGENGIACGLVYDKKTGRLHERDPDEVINIDTGPENDYSDLYKAA